MTITQLTTMDEDLLLVRANEEREKLFIRYERGREYGTEIDSWEDPTFEVYHQTDSFGFIHNEKIETKTDSRERIEILIERERKWLNMLKKWKTKNSPEKLRKRIFKGIPNKIRSEAWPKLLNLKEIKTPGVYIEMLQLARKWSTEVQQIDSDVNRQFRDHRIFRERYSIKQKSLFNVLTAYSMYNMEVGYCQGMAGLAAVLLMYMDEEDAFWGLNELLTNDKYGMHGFFIEGFPKLMRYTKHHDKIITKLMPKLKKHLDYHGVDSILYSLKWFFVIFIERVPFSLCLRIWDIFLLEGDHILSAMAYTILKMHKRQLLKCKEMDSITTFLQMNLQKDFGYDNDYVIKVLDQSIEELRRYKLNKPALPHDDELINIKGSLGKFIEPNFEAKIGRRKAIFTDNEKNVTEGVQDRREQALNDAVLDINSMNDTIDDNISCQYTGGSIYTMKTYQSNHSITTSIATSLGSGDELKTDNDDEEDDDDNNIHGTIIDLDDSSSLVESSRTGTSLTSTADISLFSGGQISIGYNVSFEDNHSLVESIKEQDEETFTNIHIKTATALIKESSVFLPISSPSSDAFRYFVEVVEKAH